MPIPLLIALVLAFGLGEQTGPGPLPRALALQNLALVAAGLIALPVLTWLIAVGLGRWSMRPGAGFGLRRRVYRILNHGLDVVTLGLFAAALYFLEWPRLLAWNLGLRHWLFVDELAQVAPFVAAQLLGWWALERADRTVMGSPPGRSSSGRALWLRARQTFGLVLPMSLIYGVGRDALQRLMPGSAGDPIGQVASMAIMGALVLVLSPLFVRLSWPTKPLPPGPLRDRLERLSRRLNFRCTDILVWDTGGHLVNAGVTGTLPMFRYVLLTDAMVEFLDPRQIEAIFGHEVGHVAHRHLAYFGFFFLGSLMLMILMELGIRSGLDGWAAPWVGGATGLEILEWTLALLGVALYFLFVFGFLSRRFERQADVYGARAVSCDGTDCPPHVDPVAPGPDGALPALTPPPAGPCPAGVRLFATALAEVAMYNGLRPEAFSWRHGSIARRIAFVESLSGHPEAARRFQARLTGLRLALVVTLLAASIAVLWLADRIEGVL